MRPFDTVAAVDWSGGDDTGPTPRADAIWACVVRDHVAEPPLYRRSHTEAEGWLADLLGDELAAGRRLMVGLDFPFAYPAGLARRIAGRSDPRVLWDWFADAFDSLPPGRGRFDVAARINALFPGAGPFWFNGLAREIEGLPRRKRVALPEGVAERRETEARAPGAFSCWQMGGAGAVGSQAMTGMAALARLRRRFGDAVAVWPFDPWDAAPIVLVEIWPSLLGDPVARRMSSDATLPRDRKGQRIKDAAQVAVLAEVMDRLAAEGRLEALGAVVPAEACREEGWILGVGCEDALRMAARDDPDPPSGRVRGSAMRATASGVDRARAPRAEPERFAGARGAAPETAHRAPGPERSGDAALPDGPSSAEDGAPRPPGAEPSAPRASEPPPDDDAPREEAAHPVVRAGPEPPPLSDDCFALPPGVDWTPVDAALARLRDGLAPVTGAEAVAVTHAGGRVLAEGTVARRSSPPGANAAVDGYGFAHAAVAPGRNLLPLVPGRAAAGAPLGRAVPEGSAARILTGALLPEGVDTVILQEDARAEGGRVAFAGPVKPRANTRAAGEDVERGAPALPEGRRLGPPDLALLSSLGIAEVRVRARLRVGVLSTGDELAAPGETLDPARTYDANRPMLLALLDRWGHEAVDLGLVPDDRAALRGRLDGVGCHAVLCSGGASAGEEDHVSAILRAEGRVTTWRVAMKPGRPLAMGLWRGVPVLGLPGNPVAAFVCALVFARPMLSAMAGSGWVEPQGFTLPAGFSKRKKAGRREYLRARVRGGRAEVFASEGSGRVSGLAWAEGLVELGEEAREVRPGDPVRYLPYGSFGL